jgi:type I restriction enzyme S subunit
MAAVDAVSATTSDGEPRRLGDVRKGYTAFLNGDILVAKITPCFENNKIAQARLSHAIGFGSTEFHVIRPRVQEADTRYLLHFLRQDKVRREGEMRMTGSAGQRRVPETFLADLMIPLPDLSEQRRIAAILDQADALRAKRRQGLAQVSSMTEAIFLEMFGDTVDNSMSWPADLVLGDVGAVVSGITKGRKVSGQRLREVPYLAVSNVKDRALDLAVVKRIDATEEEIGRYLLRRGDLVLTEGGDPDKLGRGTIWRNELEECIHQNHIFRVRVIDERIMPTFLSWLLSSARGKKYFLKCAKQTTGIASINMAQLKAFPLLLPPLELQRRFEATVAGVDALRTKALAALNQTEHLCESLQYNAFRKAL